ncbi:hypothetical protein [Woeseia oceani]|uniref:hypothetical protein n=1 Tax=Woeseia oceani TaxID=1548547 RepID=UPI0012EAC6D7|nr:hypothetical protein [Woeseia oceani]
MSNASHNVFCGSACRLWRLLAALLLPFGSALAGESVPLPALDMPRIYTHPVEREPRDLRIVTTVKSKAGEYIDAYLFEYDERGRLLLAVRGMEERYRYAASHAPAQWTERKLRWSDGHEETQLRVIDELGYPISSQSGLATDGMARKYRWKNDSLNEIRVGDERLRIKPNKQGFAESAEVWIAGKRELELGFTYENGRLTRREVFAESQPLVQQVQVYGYNADGRLRAVLDMQARTRAGENADLYQLPSAPQLAQPFDWNRYQGNHLQGQWRYTELTWDGPRLLRARRDTNFSDNKFRPDVEFTFEYDEAGRLTRNLQPHANDWRYHWSVETHPVYGEHDVARASNAVDGASLEIRYLRVSPDNRGRARDDFLESVEEARSNRQWGRAEFYPRNCFSGRHLVATPEFAAFYLRDAATTDTVGADCGLPWERSNRRVAVTDQPVPDSQEALPLFSDADLETFSERRNWSLPYAAYQACIVDAPAYIGDFLLRASNESNPDTRRVLDQKIPGFLREWADACGGGYDPENWWPICETQKGKPATHNFFCEAFERDGMLYHNPGSGLMLTGSDVRRIVFHQQGSPQLTSPRLQQRVPRNPIIVSGTSPEPNALLERRAASYETSTRVGNATFVLQVADDKLVLTVTADRAEIGRAAPELIAPPDFSAAADYDGEWNFDLAARVRDLGDRDSENDTWRSNTVVEYKRPYYSRDKPLPVERTLYARFYLRDAWSSVENELVLVPFDSAGIWAHLVGNESFGPRGRDILATVNDAEWPQVQAAIREAYSGGPNNACGAEPYAAFQRVPSDTLAQDYRRHERRVSNTSIWVHCLARELDNLERNFAQFLARHANAPVTDPNLWRLLALEARLAAARPEQQRLDALLASVTASLEVADRNINARLDANRREEERARRAEAQSQPSAKDLWMRSQGPEAYYDCLATAISAVAAGQCRMDHLKRMQNSSAFAAQVASEQRARPASNSGNRRRTVSSGGSAAGGSSSAGGDDGQAERDAASSERLQAWQDRTHEGCGSVKDTSGGRSCVMYSTGIGYLKYLDQEIKSPRSIAELAEQRERKDIANNPHWGACATDSTKLDDGRRLYYRPLGAYISETTRCERRTDGDMAAAVCWFATSWTCEQAFSGEAK